MKKSLLLIAALILIGGAVLFLNRNQERSDIVVVTTVDAPAEKSRPRNERVTTSPATAATQKTSSAKDLVVNKEEKEALAVELKDALSELPTIEDMRSLSTEELHHTPPMVRDGGALIGKKIELAEGQAERRPETLNFLMDCAEKDDLAPAVRALCWHRLLKKIPEWKVFVPVSGAKVPDDIKALSTKLD